MRALSTVAGVARHALGAGTEAILLATILAALLLALAPVYGPARTLTGSRDAAAARGAIAVPDGVFASTTTATVNPGGDVLVRARCYQAGTLVMEHFAVVDANKRATIPLGPTYLWTDGPATCTAEEGDWGRNGRWRTIASTSFDVAG
jgi:hypothetical protein